MKYEPIFHVVLYQPEIPPNTGAVGRSCVATASKLWLVRPLGFRLDDYYLRRAGLDYWDHLEWEAVSDWANLTQKLPGRNWWFFSTHAAKAYSDVRFQPGDVFVFGKETSGLPKEMIAAHPEHALRIPIRPEARSLNLSNSVAIVLFEAQRQFNLGFDP